MDYALFLIRTGDLSIFGPGNHEKANRKEDVSLVLVLGHCSCVVEGAQCVKSRLLPLWGWKNPLSGKVDTTCYPFLWLWSKCDFLRILNQGLETARSFPTLFLRKPVGTCTKLHGYHHIVRKHKLSEEQPHGDLRSRWLWGLGFSQVLLTNWSSQLVNPSWCLGTGEHRGLATTWWCPSTDNSITLQMDAFPIIPLVPVLDMYSFTQCYILYTQFPSSMSCALTMFTNRHSLFLVASSFPSC